MVRVSFLRPIDQFNGVRRFLQELKTSLQAAQYEELLISVAFAKSGPLLRVGSLIEDWRESGKQIRAIFGVDMNGTSKQALQFALEAFDEVYVTHSTSYSTFHPKFYLFSGEAEALCINGSHNLTVGGTETNFEGGTIIHMDRPEDEPTFQEAFSCWTSLLPDVCPMTRRLDVGLLDDLIRGGFVIDETVKPPKSSAVETSSGGSSQEGITNPSPFPRSYPKPPSPLPKDVVAAVPQMGAKKAAKKTAKKRLLPLGAATTVASEALVIQIVPHHNGEVFLSKLAVNQQPAFFGYPFTGKTIPKRAGNPSYPQRVPDPVVNITVFDRRGNVALTKLGFNLNTVFYATKSEIRITFSPDLLRVIQPFSVMVVRQTVEAHDYDIEIYNPGSSRYDEYVAACNQTLPSGGAAQSRKMGWL